MGVYQLPRVIDQLGIILEEHVGKSRVYIATGWPLESAPEPIIRHM